MPSHPRLANLDYDTLQQHFSMPMAEAAKAFGVCLTFFKKLCRRNGIQRWPHRKLKSLQAKIVDLQTRLEDSPNPRPDNHIRQSIEELQGLNSSEPEASAAPESAVECLALLGTSEVSPMEDGYTTPSSSEHCNLSANTQTVAAGSHGGQEATYQELRHYFTLPMTEAAKKFGVSLTLFKKICRNAGVERWPHRKLKSLTSKLEDLKQRLGHENRGKGEAELRAKLDELRCLDVDLGEDSQSSCHAREEVVEHSSEVKEETWEERDWGEEEEERGAFYLAMFSKICARDQVQFDTAVL
eukprot:TRINITY_DN4099_c0_g1_i1.p1 TRINITY_DN4099_c0_g1~~TRINITY_DN4099_c0_g1_i1.p1  ORF type:complete len:298 (-),score=59.10 TRINITY_DN4099_c0_g1_i1:142-1035(-)